jgi:hypothetical protein
VNIVNSDTKNSEKENKETKTKGKKRKNVILDDEDQLPNKKQKIYDIGSEDALWCLNYDQFIRKMKHISILEYVKKKINQISSDVVKIILDMTSNYEKTTCDENSCKFFI